VSELPSKVTCTVLVVEDNPGDAALVEDYLTELDAKYVYHIHHVTTLAGALAALIDPIPDVILLDLTLPDTSGLDGLRRLREEARNIPVVVVTGHNDEETAFNAIQAGAQDYLIKDEITPSLLRRALRYALERHRLLDQLGESLRSILESQRQMSIFMANLPGFAYRCRSNDRWTMLFVSDGCHAPSSET
jgi:CheY-like chemotaxis protein